MSSAPEVELEVLPDVSTELATVTKQYTLEPETAANLQQSFAPLFREAHEIISESRKIVVTDASQKLKIAQATLFRKALKAKRLAAEKLKTELKAESLRKSNAIQGFYNIFLHLVSGEEERLDKQEKVAALQEAARKAELKTAREAALQPYGVDVSFLQLGEMPEDVFDQLLENSRAGHEAKLAAERKALEDRIRAENERLKEEARLREENARLQREAEEKEAAAKKDREEAAAKLAAEQAAAAKAKAEADAKLAAEQAAAAKAKAEAEEKARVEREQVAAREKAQREAAEATLRAESERLEAVAAAERKKAAKAAEEAREAARKEKLRLQALAEVERQKKEAARRAASAPDREKAHALVKSIRGLPLPEMTTDGGRAFVASVQAALASFCTELDKEAEAL